MNSNGKKTGGPKKKKGLLSADFKDNKKLIEGVPVAQKPKLRKGN